MEASGVVFKGSTEGLSIIVPEEYTADQLITEVSGKIQANARRFRGARLKVTYHGIRLSADEEARLFKILDEQSGAVIESLNRSGTGAPPSAAMSASRRGQTPAPLRRFFTKGQDESDCKFIRTTVRGGTRIQYEGSVVVVGDVNPGAEIVAAGNVIVLGLLRGMVHAGAGGSRDAFISALKLKPTQLRIADLIARCPDDPDTPGVYPEIASVRDGMIVVNPLYERS